MTKAAASRSTTTRTRNAATPAPSSDQIAERAHEIFMARGGGHGRDLDDWLQAERELKPANGRRRKKD